MTTTTCSLYLPDLSQGFTIASLVDSRYVQDRGVTVWPVPGATWGLRAPGLIDAHGGHGLVAMASSASPSTRRRSHDLQPGPNLQPHRGRRGRFPPG